MHITGFVVCVGYEYMKYLDFSFSVWKPTLNDIVVITSHADGGTSSMCRDHGVECYITDAFYEDEAYFNKGRALSRCLEWKLPHHHEKDWVLFFDADILPPPDWRQRLQEKPLAKDVLYGAFRSYHDPLKTGGFGEQIHDVDPCGYFCLTHSSSSPMQKHPIFNTEYTHAGCYDSEFLDQWPKEKRVMLDDVRLIHYGEPQVNWFGVGNEDKVRKMNIRRAGGNHWKTEKVGKKF